MKTARFSWGFTLVELLIVIALIGVLAVAVLSAINPLEQINRARDVGYKNDVEQLLSALDRYYTTQQQMPWGDESTPTPQLNCKAADTAEAVGPDGGPGICGTTGCPGSDGKLITAQELKPQFKNRKFIGPTATNDNIYVGKGPNPSDSVYGCFVPLSKSERSKITTLKMITPDAALPGGNAPGACTLTGPDDPGWTTAPCYVCLPE